MNNKNNSIKEELLSPIEMEESNIRLSLMAELLNARKENNITQKELEKLSGIKQPVIARVENGNTNPTLSTMMKLLYPLGKTLYIDDLSH